MALSIEEIDKIVSKFSALHKGWEAASARTPVNPITKERTGVSQYPEYWPGYNYAAKMYDSILPHTRPDIYPAHLLNVRAPNQTDAQAEYIKANYKPTTLSVFEDFKATISRAFADQNWSIRYNEELEPIFGEDTFQRFVNSEIERFGSLEMFMKSMVPTLKLIDPNGIIAIEPQDIDTVIDEEGEEIVSNELIRPMPEYYSCKSIVGQKYGEYYMVITDDRSDVKVGSKMEKAGIVLEIYDNMNIWKVYQVGKKSELEFSEPVLYFSHNLGYVPCHKLEGMPQMVGGEIAFLSSQQCHCLIR